MTTPTPLVSVIIPAYNASRFIGEALNSVTTQTYSNLDIIVIDDGSTDQTLETVENYSQRDVRIRVISQTNRGVSFTRNRGVELANSDLIAFLDSDDRWLPDKLTRQVEFMTAHPEVAVCFGRVAFMRFDGTMTQQRSSGRLTGLKPEHLLYENPTVTTSNWMIRRDIFQKFGGFDLTMNYSEDLDYLLRIMLGGDHKIEGINDVLMCYRTNDSGLSSDLAKMEAGWNQMIEKAKKYNADLVQQHYPTAKAVHLRYFARRAIRLKLPPQVGVQYMNRALRSDWTILLKEPRRTLLTGLVAYGLEAANRVKLKPLM
jgi:glycosyltransferase involved in cell wall biosynthesis